MDREEQEGLIQSHDSSHGRQSHSVRKARIILLVCAILVFAVAFVAGFFVRQNVSRTLKRSKQTGRGPEKYHHNILMQMKAENIEKNLRDLTYVQHVAGSDDDVTQSHFIYERWKKFLGAENIQLKKYEVLLSYPVKPGNVSIYDEKKKEIIFTSHPNESRLWPDENVPNVRVPFNAYSPSGNVKGKLIYVNYGRAEDFKNLAALNISCEGKILLARYGKIFRGNKVALGEKAGAIGMIIFNDPSDYARGKTTYPDSWWLPPDGVQRGAIVIHEGDPLTPGYPATDGAYRIADKDAKLPKIPVQPISYSDALPLLQQLDGIPVPENWTDWHGGLNASYRLTMDPNNTNNILLNVNTKNEKRYIYDIIGTIRGHEEPDRLVLFGNHHDAWVMGAVDPTSGTSVLMEMARVFGEAYKTGWRPRRTIILCNWDAEEYGLIGSTEWIEDNADMLSSRAVAYLNVDCAVTGNFSIHVDGSDQLANVVFQAAQKVKDPDDESENVYQDWTRSFPDSHNPRYPKIAIPDAGSDHKTFYARYGIPVLDLEYTYDKRFYGDVSSYPVYHSLHDSFHWMKKFADPDFTHHLAIGRVWAQTGLTLADHVILPFNFTRLAWRLNLCVQDFEKTYKGKLAYKIISLDRLKHHISDFTQMSKLFDESVVKISEKSILAVRIANDQMMQVGRAFIAPEGLPGRPLTRHVVFAPARHNSYVGGCFPGMTDTIDDATKHNSSSWTEVKKQLSILEYYMEQAARAMKPAWV